MRERVGRCEDEEEGEQISGGGRKMHCCFWGVHRFESRGKNKVQIKCCSSKQILFNCGINKSC